MSNACVTTFRIIPKRKNFQLDFFRPFPTRASALLTCANHQHLTWTLTLTSRLTPSEAPAQRSDEWFALRKNRLTTSTFSTALGLWKRNRRVELWQEKISFPSDTKPTLTLATKQAMQWGVHNESTAIEKYKTITGHQVSQLGFATHSELNLDWIGASPDGLIGFSPNAGILEVKCPFNKGKPESAVSWTKIPFYYMPQIQGQMEIMDRDWVDLYCWTENGSTLFRVCRDREYWKLIHRILHEFWFENVVPAREALSIGNEDEAKKYEPMPTHKQTGLVIHKSIKLVSESKLLCREVAGNVEFSNFDPV